MDRAKHNVMIRISNENTTEPKKFLSVEDYENICRTCLNQSYLQPIADYEQNSIILTELLWKHLNISFKNEDQLPKNICLTCRQRLYDFHAFTEICLDTEQLLINQLANEKSHKIFSESVSESEQKDGGKYATESGNYYSDIQQSDRYSSAEENENEEAKKEEILKVELKNEEPKRHQKSKRPVTKEPPIPNGECPYCKKMIQGYKMRQHLRVHTKEKPFGCNMCHQRFSLHGNLTRHMKTHTGEKPHKCQTCGKGFIQKTSLQSHRKLHEVDCETTVLNNRTVFTCHLCGRHFRRLGSYNLHVQRHSKDGATIEEKNAETSNTDDDKKHICPKCGKGYKTYTIMRAHALTHGEKAYLCNNCGKGFYTNAALQSHIKTHTGVKPYVCTQCNKTFAHSGSLDSHMLTHSGTKPFHCTHCEKRFTQMSHLRYHLRTHSGERPYACAYCAKTFALKGNLTVHVRTHTGETPYVCTCGKGFYDSSSMKKHAKSHVTLKRSASVIKMAQVYRPAEISVCENK